MATSLCLVAVLGTGILCTGEKPPAVVSDFCDIAAPQVEKFSQLTATELASLKRHRKEAMLTLRRDVARLCQKEKKK